MALGTRGQGCLPPALTAGAHAAIAHARTCPHVGMCLFGRRFVTISAVKLEVLHALCPCVTLPSITRIHPVPRFPGATAISDWNTLPLGTLVEGALGVGRKRKRAKTVLCCTGGVLISWRGHFLRRKTPRLS